MFKICEFELYQGEHFIIAEPFGLEGGTQGTSMEDAIEMAVDWLKCNLEDWDIYGIEPPPTPLNNEPQHGGRVVVVAVEAGRETVEKVTASQAARLLGVTPGRITQLIAANLLTGWRDGRNTYVSIDSIQARMEDRGILWDKKDGSAPVDGLPAAGGPLLADESPADDEAFARVG